MMRLFFLCTILLLFSCRDKVKQNANQVKHAEETVVSKPEEVTAAVSALLPVPYSYQLKRAKKWHDASGENWLVLYETGSYIEKGKSNSSAKLAAILYQKSDSGFVQKWKMNDYIQDCDLDVTCSFYDDQLSITDIDNNGYAEVTMLYALSCKGDVSPNSKKLIMYEKGKKYAIRGEELMVLQKDTIGGAMNVDASFKDAPPAFLAFAKDYWKKFGFQKYE